ncbi:MAG TPA: DUF1841 family protein [Acidiferrobacter sp.]|nr:DUF1841 family protein [Acidiferrobacter sp.]
MWSNDRAVMRQVFYTAWQRFQDHTPLDGVEAMIVEALLAHPEYQALFAHSPPPDNAHTDTNPFLHLGLHIALAEQIATDRPPGVIAEWTRLCTLTGNPHRAHHLMMESLEETLFEAQQQNQMPDEAAYLARLRELPKLAIRVGHDYTQT